MKKEFKLIKDINDDTDWLLNVQHAPCMLCYEELEKFFKIPKDVETIHLVFNNKQTESNYEIRQVEATDPHKDYNPIEVKTKRGWVKVSATYIALRDRAEEFGFPLFASIEY